MGTRKHRKLTDEKITDRLLTVRGLTFHRKGRPAPKWHHFARVMMYAGLEVSLYEARQTVSKYLTVTDGRRHFKVRFSNHAPISAREANGDCDFFVGVNNFTTTTTADAIRETLDFFGVERIPTRPAVNPEQETTR